MLDTWGHPDGKPYACKGVTLMISLRRNKGFQTLDEVKLHLWVQDLATQPKLSENTQTLIQLVWDGGQKTACQSAPCSSAPL